MPTLQFTAIRPWIGEAAQGASGVGEGVGGGGEGLLAAVCIFFSRELQPHQR